MSRTGNPLTNLSINLTNSYKKAGIYWNNLGRPNKGKAFDSLLESRIKVDIFYRDLILTAENEKDSSGIVPTEVLLKISNILERKLKRLDDRFGVTYGEIIFESLNYFSKVIEYRYTIQLRDNISGDLLASIPASKLEDLYAEEICTLFEEAESNYSNK